MALKPVDPRAGRMCSHCNQPKSAKPVLHCPSGKCRWWRCDRCKAVNDPQGRNDRSDPSGRVKDGSKR